MCAEMSKQQRDEDIDGVSLARQNDKRYNAYKERCGRCWCEYVGGNGIYAGSNAGRSTG